MNEREEQQNQLFQLIAEAVPLVIALQKTKSSGRASTGQVLWENWFSNMVVHGMPAKEAAKQADDALDAWRGRWDAAEVRAIAPELCQCGHGTDRHCVDIDDNTVHCNDCDCDNFKRVEGFMKPPADEAYCEQCKKISGGHEVGCPVRGWLLCGACGTRTPPGTQHSCPELRRIPGDDGLVSYDVDAERE